MPDEFAGSRIIFSAMTDGLQLGFGHGFVLFRSPGGPLGGVRLTFLHALAGAPTGRDELSARSHFLLGRNPSMWRTDVPSYREVLYSNLYKGVDLVYRSDSTGVAYRFQVDSGADLSQVAWSYDGGSLRIVDRELEVEVGSTIIHNTPPTALQDSEAFPCDFILKSVNTVGILCPDRDPARPMIIDPLVYATYVGGRDIDAAWAIAVDGSGNVYVAGSTGSFDFPVTSGAYNSTFRMNEAFVAKFDPSGQLAYSTFLGGGNGESADGIAVDAAGRAFVVGTTTSPDFPTSPTAYDRVLNGSRDAFVVELNAAGTAIVYATLLGGSGNDDGRSITLGPGGAASVAGTTESNDFPTTPNAVDPTLGGTSDGFVATLDSTGSSLLGASYLGGADMEKVFTMASDSQGHLFIGGVTSSLDFPTTPKAISRSLRGISDGFVARVSQDGVNLSYSTYLGGAGPEIIMGLAVDPDGNPYVTGYTESADMPVTAGAPWPSYLGDGDAFVAKLDWASGSPLYLTYLGGSGYDAGHGVAVDSLGNAVVIGQTGSSDLTTTPGALQRNYGGGGDTLVVRLNSTGMVLDFSTYLGGSSSDDGRAIALDPIGRTYLAGRTSSTDFPLTPGAWNSTFRGMYDSFVASLASFPITVYTAPTGLLVDVDSASRQSSFVLWCMKDITIGVQSPQTTPGKSYVFSGWSDAGAQSHSIQCSRPLTLVATFTVEFAVTVTSDPAGLQVSVDSVNHMTPAQFFWPENSIHMFVAPEIQGVFEYVSWSDSGTRIHNVTILGPATFTALYRAVGQLTLTVTASPNVGFAPLWVAFNATVAGGHLPHAILWDFDDGTNSTEQSPVHRFSREGRYNVTVTVRDRGGGSIEKSLIIIVSRSETFGDQSVLVLIALVLAVSLAAILLALWIRKRRRNKPQ